MLVPHHKSLDRTNNQIGLLILFWQSVVSAAYFTEDGTTQTIAIEVCQCANSLLLPYRRGYSIFYVLGSIILYLGIVFIFSHNFQQNQ